MILKKPTKTISGVTPLAVMLHPRKCPHGTCLYCPSLNVPQSYTPNSPAVLRAKSLNYDPYKQVINRLNSFKTMNHPTDKIELIIMGGTFLSYPIDFQYKFIKKCYDALNGKISKSLEEAKSINETAKHRCVALCIETRPDVCSDKEIKRMLEFGATRVELGVQMPDDKLYKINKRGHTVKDVVQATKRLKDAGFKVGYHLMPGLPGSNPEKDLKLFKKLFSDERFRPDQIKIYPCQVLPGSELVKLYKEGKYEPYSLDELIPLLIKFKLTVPRYCRIMRIMREIPPRYMIAGTKRIDLRKVLAEELRKQNKKCKCIRCREVGLFLRDNPQTKLDNTLTFKKTEYSASQGKELFLEIVNKDDIIFGLCRLRINKDKTAFIRELHVYGPQTEIGKKNKSSYQHKGLGSQLIKEAENIAKKEKCKILNVISGVGVREYYRRLGYSLSGYYMKKTLI
ncbi:MAG: tRNA uridine(34) 5-carboxymethylaminomethyl modification radical SAM/GNAT enzyme Elp3 [Candidatus Pacearchaeota archaeon]